MVMPFGLKNEGATYQRMFTLMFKDQTRDIVEVYIDDIKQGGLSDHPDMPHILLLCTFMILMFFFLNLIKY